MIHRAGRETIVQGVLTPAKEADMNAIWAYDDGHLVARNEDGDLLRKWLAEEVIGWGLAVLLNQAGSLS